MGSLSSHPFPHKVVAGGYLACGFFFTEHVLAFVLLYVLLEEGFKDRGIEPAVFVGKGQLGITEEKRQPGVKYYLGGKKKVMIISSAGSKGLSLGNTTMVAAAGLDGHFNLERILQSEARGVRADSLLHRPEEKRQILVKRYYSTVPKEEAGTIRNILNIIPLYYAIL